MEAYHSTTCSGSLHGKSHAPLLLSDPLPKKPQEYNNEARRRGDARLRPKSVDQSTFCDPIDLNVCGHESTQRPANHDPSPYLTTASGRHQEDRRSEPQWRS